MAAFGEFGKARPDPKWADGAAEAGRRRAGT